VVALKSIFGVAEKRIALKIAYVEVPFLLANDAQAISKLPVD